MAKGKQTAAQTLTSDKEAQKEKTRRAQSSPPHTPSVHGEHRGHRPLELLSICVSFSNLTPFLHHPIITIFCAFSLNGGGGSQLFQHFTRKLMTPTKLLPSTLSSATSASTRLLSTISVPMSLLLLMLPLKLSAYGAGGYPAAGGGYGGGGYSGYSQPGASGFIYRCPVTMAPYAYSPYGINYCGTGSLFHYYVCCDYNPTECCLQLEPWVIIALVILGILGLLVCIGCCALCFIAQRK